MKIMYTSTVCSDEMFEYIYLNSKIKPQQQAQKFHRLLTKGLLNNNQNNSIHFVSRPPVNSSTKFNAKSIFINEKVGQSNYHYLRVVKVPLINHIFLFVQSILSTLKWCIRSKDNHKVIICDVLNLSISLGALIIGKFFSVKTIAIVTDIPVFMQNYESQKKSVLKKIASAVYITLCNFFMYKYDGYVVLTEAMNQMVNPKANPHVVIEGMVDSEMDVTLNNLDNKYKEKIILYSGALRQKYGIKTLIEAFTRIDNDNLRLWLYGSGEMADSIIEYEKIDKRIKYFGTVPNRIVVREQMMCTLLVNPRPSDEEFTKYSFPSKNMEYMVSGTPVLTTALKGMPLEYHDFVFILEDESTEGMSKKLEEIMNLEIKDLHEVGKRAACFVLDKKNNNTQANKIIDLYRSII